MQPNPYSPPTADVQEKIIKIAVRRPISVWLLEALLIAFAFIFLRASLRLILAISTNHVDQQDAIGLAIHIVWFFVKAAVIGFTIYSFHRGFRLARWLGVAMLTGLTAFILFRTDNTQYASDAESAGGSFANYVLFPLLFVWWAYAIGFSQKAKLYFSR